MNLQIPCPISLTAFDELPLFFSQFCLRTPLGSNQRPSVKRSVSIH
jgi:hypothetical protein